VDAASTREILRVSGCDGVMVGRAVQGNPWALAEVRAALLNKPVPVKPEGNMRWHVIHEHLLALKEHYGEYTASKLARKHVIWYSKGLNGSAEFRRCFQRLTCWDVQLTVAEAFFYGGAAQDWLRAA